MVYQMSALIAQQIHNARKQAGFSQRTIAERAGVTQSQISKLEQGKEVQMHTLLRVAQTLDLQLMLLPFDVAHLTQQWLRQRGGDLTLENFEQTPWVSLDEAD